MSNSSGTQKKRVPVKEGLFHMPESPGDKPYLIGSKCKVCNCVVWPKRPVCPACVRDDTMEEIPLSTRAKLESFSVLHQAPYGFDFPVPYLQAIVRLPEGITLFTMVTGAEPRSDALTIGQEMEMVVDKVRDDNQGNEIVSWKFRPV